MIIDAHQHFWNYDPQKYSWINDSMQSIRKDFKPADLQKIFQKNLIHGSVAVQAEQTEEETNFLIETAKQNSFVKGIVGWVDLQSQDIEERLTHFSQFPIVKGFRHIVQSEPEEFLYDQNFRRGISL